MLFPIKFSPRKSNFLVNFVLNLIFVSQEMLLHRKFCSLRKVVCSEIMVSREFYFQGNLSSSEINLQVTRNITFQETIFKTKVREFPSKSSYFSPQIFLPSWMVGWRRNLDSAQAVMCGHFWSVTGFGGPNQGYPPKKFQIFFLKSFVNGQIGKVKKFHQLTLSRLALIDVEKKFGSI